MSAASTGALPRIARRLHRPSLVVAAGALLLIAAVWTGTLIRTSGRPPTLDERVTTVASQLQCPVCNGESVAESSSPVAQEMRSLIREQLAAGMSDDQALRYFRDRYGDTILESPPRQGFTGLIWLGPLVALFAGLLILGRIGNEWRAKRVSDAPHTSDGMHEKDQSDTDLLAYRKLLQRELEAEEGYFTPEGRDDAWR